MTQMVTQVDPYEVIGALSHEDNALLPSYDDVYEDYRDFVRKIQCVICQLEIHAEDSDIEDISYEPELVNVSDPHHLVSRGAGGPDAENLIPLCRKHHQEFGTLGVDEFQTKYNVNLKTLATHLYETYMDKTMQTDASKYAYAIHKQALSRIQMFTVAGLELGLYLSQIKDRKVDGKYIWEILGFSSFYDYASSSREGGGLDISMRQVRRLISYIELYDKLDEGKKTDLIEMGMTKANMIAPMVDKAETTADVDEIFERAKSMTAVDFRKWKRDQEKGPKVDRPLRTMLADRLRRTVIACGGTPDDEIIDDMVNDIIDQVRHLREYL